MLSRLCVASGKPAHFWKRQVQVLLVLLRRPWRNKHARSRVLKLFWTGESAQHQHACKSAVHAPTTITCRRRMKTDRVQNFKGQGRSSCDNICSSVLSGIYFGSWAPALWWFLDRLALWCISISTIVCVHPSSVPPLPCRSSSWRTLVGHWQDNDMLKTVCKSQ